MNQPGKRPHKSAIEQQMSILDTTARLIMLHGFNRVSVDAIAAEAQVSKRSIYKLWSGKDRIAAALFARETSEYLDDVITAIQSDPRGGTFAALVTHALRCLMARPLQAALLRGDLTVLGEFAQRHVPELPARRTLMRAEFIVQMQTVGLIRTDINAEVLSYVLSSISQGILNVPPPDDPSFSMEAVFTTLNDVIVALVTPVGEGDLEAGKAIILRFLTATRDAIYTALSRN